jgi:signal recognition particle subunit SRP54
VNVAVQVCRRAHAEAQKAGVDVLILDTAGRLHVNDELMGELHMVQKALTPHHIFLVVDAMTGQDAVNSAKAFHERLTVDGIVLTKFDSDTRGGAALSRQDRDGCADPVHRRRREARRDRAVPRRADGGPDPGHGRRGEPRREGTGRSQRGGGRALQAKMAKGEMTMDDFLGQLRTLRRMGPMKQLLGLLPGLGSALRDTEIDDGQLTRVEAMIQSMTKDERSKPGVMNPGRRRRIAAGSGTEQKDVGQLVKQFDTINKLSKQMSGLSAAGKVSAVRELGAGGAPGLPGLPGMRTKGSTQTKSRGVKQRKKKRR